MRNPVALASFSLLVVPPLVAQAWQQVATPTSPPPRYAHRLATDSAAGRVVLFGGLGASYFGDTWEFDGTTWTQRLVPGPSPRGQHGMAFDALRGVTVLFGGLNGPGLNGYLGDTWEYAGGVWQQRSSVGMFFPQARFAHALAFDVARLRIVMFGGRGRSTVLLGDTWEWDGTSWTPISTSVAPSPRSGAVMAFDPLTGHALLFGGIQVGGYALPTTWSWDGANWSALTTVHAPSPRSQPVVANDLGGSRVVLYGGFDGTDLFDTWQWDGIDWQLLTTSVQPGVPALPAMAPGPLGQHVVLFGGQDSGGGLHQATWRNGWFASVVPLGTGCGTPAVTLASAAGSLPALGQAFRSTIGNVPAGAVAFQSYGFSDTVFAGLSLPLDLGFAGLPGCVLYHDLAATFLPCLDNGNGTAASVLPVPNLPTLVGAKVYLQAYLLGAPGNATGLLTSNALSLVLGHS